MGRPAGPAGYRWRLLPLGCRYTLRGPGGLGSRTACRSEQTSARYSWGAAVRIRALCARDGWSGRVPELAAGVDEGLGPGCSRRVGSTGHPARRAQHDVMEDVRNCEQCGTVFKPRREHARFCSAACRVTWNRSHDRGWAARDSPLSWSMSALEDTTDRLGKAEAMNLPEALAVISETVWWVTLVDGTLIRYHHDVYDHAIDELGPAERKLIEGTLTGLRFVRNCMGYYVDPADFIQPQQTPSAATPPLPAGRGGKYPPRYAPRCRSVQGHGKPAGTCITARTSPTAPSGRPSTGPPHSSPSSPAAAQTPERCNSQAARSIASGACLSCGQPSVSVCWGPSLSAAIITHLNTRRYVSARHAAHRPMTAKRCGSMVNP